MTSKPKRLVLSKMTKAQARMAIAQDVIAHLDSRKYKGSAGTYVGTKRDGSLQELADSNAKCEVCALGAGVVSAARLFNRCNSVYVENNVWFNEREYMLGGWDTKRILRKYFTETQLNRMETAFERRLMGDYYFAYYPEADSYIQWGKRYKNNTARLRAIWQNVLDNNGDFVI